MSETRDKLRVLPGGAAGSGPGADGAGEGLIARAVGKTYKKRPVVRNVSVQVRRGEAVGLLGPNGAGKTTTFYMIVGLVRPDTGSITLDGADLTLQPMYRRARMGEAWLPNGGGDAARHCLALSKLEVGEADVGARMLESLAADSQAAPVARARVFDQADQAWMVAGEPDRAVAAGTRALALSPDDVDLLADRAAALMALDRFEEVARDLGQALEIDASRDDVLVMRGSALRHMGRLDEARDDIDRALGRDPDDAEALLERGILRERSNDASGARADWERAISLEPDSDTADLAQQDLALLDAGPDRR